MFAKFNRRLFLAVSRHQSPRPPPLQPTRPSPLHPTTSFGRFKATSPDAPLPHFPYIAGAVLTTGACLIYSTTNIAEAAATTTNSTTTTTTKPKAKAPAMLGPDFIADAVEKALPALVNITVEINNGWSGSGVSTGSGFIVSEDGYVVTNNHVVAAGFSGGGKVIVTMSNGQKYRGRVHSRDKASDLALVKIEENYKNERFPVMKRGISSSLKLGQFVIALGSPLTLSNSVTHGIVSNVARSSSEMGMSNTTDFIQTDAAINQGNSGGPLCNIDGEVIGINTMKTADGQGIGFAIPMDAAWPILLQLREKRTVTRPWIGFKMKTLDRTIIKYERTLNPNFPPVEQGIMITNVAEGSPAAKGGLQLGDIITSFDGSVVTTTRDIQKMVGRMNIGAPIDVVVLRNGSEKKLVLVSEAAQHGG